MKIKSGGVKHIKSDSRRFPKSGSVSLVGAGPGDPDLITVRGANALSHADVVVYDRLVNPELLKMTRDGSEHIYVGKRAGKPSVSQDQINRILLSKALEGKFVVRLKGGDPFVFGRGGEECEALSGAGIRYEVVPGISSALAAPAFAGIPVTHRKLARSFTVITGHTIRGEDDAEVLRSAGESDTLIILMGLKNLEEIARRLIGFGRAPDTPAAVVERASYLNQRTVVGTLSTIGERAEGMESPATIIISPLAAMANDLSWFDQEETTEVEASPQLKSKIVG